MRGNAMPVLTDEQSIPALLKQMTVREKLDLLIGSSFFRTTAMPQYGIPSLLYLDGATGVNMLQYVMELISEYRRNNPEEKKEENVGNESGAGAFDFVELATTDIPFPDCLLDKDRQMMQYVRERIQQIRPGGEEPGCFPPGMLLGATWEPETVNQVAVAVAREAMAFGVDVLLGTPNVNIHRDPKNGRLFESFSEDPYLSKTMAPAFVKGVQDQGMVADVKHFAANNQETLRQGINEHISQRALREIYLPAFEAAVKEGGVDTVMSAYNSINGVPCAHNHWLLTELLKEEWGFEGQVVSDWGAVCDQVAGLNAGNDLEMPGPKGKDSLLCAVEDGRISSERLDDAVSRALRTILRSPAFAGRKFTKIDNRGSRDVAYNAAVEGITLLKNDGILPLQLGTKLSLFGGRSVRFMESGAGSAQVNTSKTTSLLVELSRYTDTVLLEKLATETETVIITAGASGQEGRDRSGMDFDLEDKVMLEETISLAKAKGKKVILILNVAGPVELLPYMENLDALVCIYFPGMEGAHALADILFGTVSPSGKLPITFPKTYRQTPTSINFPGENGEVNYGEGIFVGYRYYDYKDIEPLFPFGFGLSYSRFSIYDAQIAKSKYSSRAAEPLSVSVKIKNEGKMAAKEVVQLYVRCCTPKCLRPEKELKGFQKVVLQPGEEETVILKLWPQDFATYDTKRNGWIVQPGEYQLLLGNSSRNLTAQATVLIEGPDPYGCSLYAPIVQIAQTPAAVCVCENVLGEAFDIDAFKSDVIYFGSCTLKSYLETRIHTYDQTSTQWQTLLENLNKELEQI